MPEHTPSEFPIGAQIDPRIEPAHDNPGRTGEQQQWTREERGESPAGESEQAEAGQRAERGPDESLLHEPIDAAIADSQIRISLDRARSGEPGRHSLGVRRWQLHRIAGSAEVVGDRAQRWRHSQHAADKERDPGGDRCARTGEGDQHHRSSSRSTPARIRGDSEGRPSCTNPHSAPANSPAIIMSTSCPLIESYGSM